jgi:hypothetical protein
MLYHKGSPSEKSRRNYMQAAGKLETASTLRLHIKKEDDTWRPDCGSQGQEKQTMARRKEHSRKKW